MGEFVAEAIIKKLVLANKVVKQAKVVILGLTFKENTPDTRNSKVLDVIAGLKEYGIKPIIVDPVADKEEVKKVYEIDLIEIEKIENIDCLVLAVAHDEFKKLGLDYFDKLYGERDKILIDVKSVFTRRELEDRGYNYWRL